MIGKKINELATKLDPISSDLTIIGDPSTGVSKKVTLAQIASLFSGAIVFVNNYASLPVTGTIDIIYCLRDSYKIYIWNGGSYVETLQILSQKGSANGYASLDSSGKVPISQLPSSIMEYKGMWNAATNTPTLANGTGDTGDVYICNVAGSVNFGAGVISFAVGDYVIYSGSIWQRSSGATGTVTSVALSVPSGLSVSGSPITTSGTIAITGAGNTLQYLDGTGALQTFPTLTGYIPYTGATTAIDLNAKSVVNISNLGINTTTVPTILLRAVGDNNSSSRIAMRGYSSNASSSSIRVTKFRGTVSAPQAPQSGDSLGKFELAGYGTTSSDGYPQASFEGLATENWGATARGTKIQLKITPNTTITQVIALTINQDKSAVFENSITGTSIIKTGGTSSQFLKADGTIDSNTYVDIISNQSIAGTKYFSNVSIFQVGIKVWNGNYVELYDDTNTYSVLLRPTTLTATRIINFPDKAGTIALTTDLTGGTVTSVGMTMPLGLSVTGSPITTSGTLALSFTSGYSIPTTASQTTWDTAYTNRITSLTTTGASGSATLVSNTLNIPTYTLAGLGGISLTSLSATTPLSYNNTTGAFSIQVANTSQSGYLSSTDWNTFNNKQNALTNPVTGTGTSGQVAYFNGTSSITSNAAFAFTPTTKLLVNNIVTASSGTGVGTSLTSTITPQTSGDNLIGLDVAANYLGGISSLGAVSFGSGYTLGTYTNVPINGASGTSALATINIYSSYMTFAITTAGSGYSLYETISIPNTNIGGTGSGLLVSVDVLANNLNPIAIRANGSISIPYDNVSFTVGNNADIGIVKKPNNSGFFAYGLYNDFSIVQSDASTVYSKNNFNSRLVIKQSTGNVLINQTSDNGTDKLQVTGSAKITLNQNAETIFAISNTTAGTGSASKIRLISETVTSGEGSLAKFSGSYTPYKTIGAGDLVLYNTTAGNITILNDKINKNINFAAGGVSTAQATLFSTGNFAVGSTADNATDKLQVTGSAKFTGNVTTDGTFVSNNATLLTNGTTGGVSITTTNNRIYINATTNVRVTDIGSISGTLNFRTSGTIQSGAVYSFTNGLTGATALGYTINISAVNSTQSGGNIRILNIEPTLSNENNSQTFKGIYYNPTITGLVANTPHTAFENTTGNVLLGTTSGSTGIGATSTINASAILQVTSTTQGILPPRMTTTQRDAILSPATGLQVYNTTTNTNDFYNGSAWASGASGTYVTSVTGTSPIVSSGGTTPAISIPVATTSVNGYLSSTDWTTFNNKQGAITLTTTGTSGAATFISNTLNIPQYQGVLTNPVTGTGTTNYLPKFTGASTIGDSAITDDGTTVTLVSRALSGTSASFSSSVTTSTSFVSNLTNGYGLLLNRAAVTNYNGISLQTASAGQWFIGMRENLSSNNYIIYNENGTDALTITKANSNVLIGTTTDAGYKLDVNGTGRINGNLTVQGGVSVPSATANGYYTLLSSTANAASREYRIVNDAYGYGDFAIYKATTQGGSTFNRELILSGGNLTIGNIPSTGTGALYAGAATFSSSVTATQFNAAVNTNNSQVNTGSAEIQSYAINNSWIGDNVYFNGVVFKYRNNGYASQVYFQTDGSIVFRIGGSSTGTAGGNASLTNALVISNTGAATFSSTLGINGVADNVKSGSYAPTITASVNVTSASNTGNAIYSRVGNVVTVSGMCSVSNTAVGATIITISLPIASSLTNGAGDANGTGAYYTGGAHGVAQVYSGSGVVVLSYTALGINSPNISYQFTYLIN
jgi:hypothetical protein